MIDIKNLENPQIVKNLNEKELTELAVEIRRFMVDCISKNGGYLASNLSIVEIVIALHRCFDLSKDDVFFDGGYQSYAHKILTGRASSLKKLHKDNNTSDYFDKRESVYDRDFITSGLGLAYADAAAISNELKKNDKHIISIVGEETILMGSSFEALVDIGKNQRKVIIVLNDNGDYRNRPTISDKVHPIFNNLRDNREYLAVKKAIKSSLNKTESGKSICNKLGNFKNIIKNQLIDGGIFSAIGINYYGPIDGHDIHCLLKAFYKAQNEDGPVIIHCLTKKGRGYELLENGLKQDHLYSDPFDQKTGRAMMSTPKNYLDYSNIVAMSLEIIMQKHDRIVAILSDTDSNSYYKMIKAKYPNRTIDVGFRQELAIALAYALSKDGYRPFLLLDATTIPRCITALKEIIIRYKVPCVIALDNAGMIKDIGDHYQGIYDVSYLNNFEDIVIAQGHDYKEIMNIFYLGFLHKTPYFIRMPHIAIPISDTKDDIIEIASWQYVRKLSDFDGTIISYGSDLDIILKELTVNDLPYQLVNARFIRPVDKDILEELKKSQKKIIVYAPDDEHNGLYTSILKEFKDNRLKDFSIKKPLKVGSLTKLRKDLSLDWDSISEVIRS